MFSAKQELISTTGTLKSCLLFSGVVDKGRGKVIVRRKVPFRDGDQDSVDAVSFIQLKERGKSASKADQRDPAMRRTS